MNFKMFAGLGMFLLVAYISAPALAVKVINPTSIATTWGDLKGKD